MGSKFSRHRPGGRALAGPFSGGQDGMGIFYPKCPVCGGKSSSAIEEPEWLHKAAHGGHHLISHAAKHNPLVGVAVAVGAAGYAVYRRAPGGGRKRCDSCGHHFS